MRLTHIQPDQLNLLRDSDEAKDHNQNVDTHVGRKLRQQRVLLGFSQGKLGELVGLTFQQVQKYERGSNRVAASRLYQFSKALKVPITFFFEGLPQQFLAEDPTLAYTSPIEAEESRELLEAYYKISNKARRKTLLELAKALAEQPEQENIET